MSLNQLRIRETRRVETAGELSTEGSEARLGLAASDGSITGSWDSPLEFVQRHPSSNHRGGV